MFERSLAGRLGEGGGSGVGLGGPRERWSCWVRRRRRVERCRCCWCRVVSDLVRVVRAVARVVGREVMEVLEMVGGGMSSATVSREREWSANSPSGGSESARSVSADGGEDSIASYLFIRVRLVCDWWGGAWYMLCFEFTKHFSLHLALERERFVGGFVEGADCKEGLEGVGVALKGGDGARVVVRCEPLVDVDPVLCWERC